MNRDVIPDASLSRRITSAGRRLRRARIPGKQKANCVLVCPPASATRSSGGRHPQGYVHAVMWTNGAITDLGTLGGTQSTAYPINNLSQVTGWAHTASEATHVFLWSAGNMTDHGTFGLDPVGEAINNPGAIVGQSANGAFI